ncbi:hypothetical protein [Nafulsella turpanensis]|uniref:hypothetical protein n=1 Tax=Nafulsella turpanensis TaxID=1265690 RepID=UPI0003451C78|nr:hypothetical protein [Nafulsella turpanensis]
MPHVEEKYQSPATPVAVFMLFRLQEGRKWWGFRQMGLSRQYLSGLQGLKFGAMMGTGAGAGFSIKPDFGRYAVFSSWQTEKAAENFIQTSPFVRSIRQRCQEVYTLKMLPVSAKGYWQGSNPFLPLHSLTTDYKGPLVALTRASIRFSRLYDFWRHVPGVSAETQQAEGLLAQVGIGEWPVIQQGTVSLWQSQEKLKAFAYGMRRHQEVIHKTRSRNWYSEELFARFIPLQATGSWNGNDPLAAYLSLS